MFLIEWLLFSSRLIFWHTEYDFALLPHFFLLNKLFISSWILPLQNCFLCVQNAFHPNSHNYNRFIQRCTIYKEDIIKWFQSCIQLYFVWYAALPYILNAPHTMENAFQHRRVMAWIYINTSINAVLTLLSWKKPALFSLFFFFIHKMMNINFYIQAISNKSNKKLFENQHLFLLKLIYHQTSKVRYIILWICELLKPLKL